MKLLMALLFVACTCNGATTVVDTVSFPLEKALSNACAAATSGDTLVIPAGTFPWTNRYDTPAKKLTIRGAGTNSETRILFYNTPSTALTWVFGASTTADFQDVSRITFDGNGLQRQFGIAYVYGSVNGPATFRVHHCIFTNSNVGSSRGLYADSNGLIDHCTFTDLYNGITIVGGGFLAWTNYPTVLGTATNLFIEDNRFLFADVGNGPQDAYDGSSFVFRHNYVTETVGGVHGFDSGGYASPKNYEFSNNVWTNTGAGLANPLQFRGGTGVIYNETFDGYNFQPVLDNYRSCINGHASTGWGPCCGTNVYDGNTPGGFGYPCYQQIGRTTLMASLPIAMWNCKLAGSLITTWSIPTYLCTTNDPPADGPGLIPHIILGRDATNTLAAPTWYTSYTYPHPLNLPLDPDSAAVSIGAGVTIQGNVTIR